MITLVMEEEVKTVEEILEEFPKKGMGALYVFLPILMIYSGVRMGISNVHSSSLMTNYDAIIDKGE